ncbi:HNH endonuclease signature motif containing protein [Sphingobium sp. HT1-2]|uniref:HNH endonuclease signature motif containing protein n=1 Tax=Sphingobium sp. HT1-2 TaxID=3111640 RepID=UPI003BFF8FED
MKPRPLPHADILRALLDYDPDTGVLTWLPRPASMFAEKRTSAVTKAKAWNAQFAGKPALCSPTIDGYLKGGLLGRHVLAHRVAWVIFWGQEPEEIDHENGNRAQNNIDNLRDVTCSENNRNRATPSTNKSGHLGVCWSSEMGKWLAYIRAEAGRIKHLGYFTELEHAVEARADAALAHGYHRNHGRKGIAA